MWDPWTLFTLGFNQKWTQQDISLLILSFKVYTSHTTIKFSASSKPKLSSHQAWFQFKLYSANRFTFFSTLEKDILYIVFWSVWLLCMCHLEYDHYENLIWLLLWHWHKYTRNGKQSCPWAAECCGEWLCKNLSCCSCDKWEESCHRDNK